MAVILQFRSSIAVVEGEHPQGASSTISDVEQILQSMQAVDVALSEIRAHLLEEALRSAEVADFDNAPFPQGRRSEIAERT